MHPLIKQAILPLALGSCVSVAQQATAPAAPPAVTPTTPEAKTAEAKVIALLQGILDDFGGLKFYAAENAALPGAVENRIVFYGDSITYFWGHGPAPFFPGKSYVNRGISGQTTPQMLIRFRQDVIDLHPEAVVILAGTNDIAGNTGPSTLEMIEDNLSSMAELARAHHIRVIFSSVLPAARYPWRPGVQPAPEIQALNRWIASYCAQQKLVYLDYYSAMADSNGGMKEGLSTDGVHPNAAGYAIMAPLAEQALRQSLRSQP